MTSRAPVCLLLAAAFVEGCCIPLSETRLEEAAPAWEAAFHAPIPEGVAVTRGYYWRGIHWSTEYCWFFAVEPNEAFYQEFIASNGMEEVADAHSVEDLVMEMIFTPPEWFAPAGPSYQVWRDENLFLLRDSQQGTLFLYDGVL